MLDMNRLPRFVSVAVSRALEAESAVAEAVAQIDRREACFVLAFAPNHLPLGQVAAALDAYMGGVPVFGCTTAGQITPEGYETGALMLVSFPRRYFRCASMLITPLNPLSMQTIADDATRLRNNFQRTAGWRRLGLLMADGVSKQEDLLASTLESCLGDIPIFGGSAGDALTFEQTYVLHRGEFHPNAALLLLIETALDFRGLGFDHFLPTEKLMVVTDAVPEERLVLELNGAPAAQEYARAVGCQPQDLSPEIFAENPMLVRQNMNYHVRAIHATHGADGLAFLGAIDDGLILTLGQGTEIIQTLETGLDQRDDKGMLPDFILGFDCVLRKLEFEQKGMCDEVSEVFRRRRVLGFNTYGEQHCGVHVNQTFVGVAFFDPVPEGLS